MRVIEARVISKVVEELCRKANIELRQDVLSALKSARDKESSSKARRILDIIVENARLARKKNLPICQDTGMVVVYISIGQDVRIKGGLKNAVERGVRLSYSRNYFRKSIVKDPLIRKNTNTNLPPIIYSQIVPGNKVDIRVVIKGFGCENAGKTKMFRPTVPLSLIEDFIIEAVKSSGSKACPPMYIGVGIGGTLDKAVSLSKEAIFRQIAKFSNKSHIAKLERSILRKLNRLNIGPMGVGGKATALGVSILTYPTHIAGLPVAVNISCHATRDARRIV